jgi:hypothetical protein
MNFLLCDSPEHADAVDSWIMDHLRETDGAHGGSWSGVFVDDSFFPRYAVLWDSPASSLFGQPYDAATGAGDPAVVVVAGDMVVRDASGKVTGGHWDRYELPPDNDI